ncbi:glycoside hydrolase family 3 C-terminal domain-containing protein [Mangrovimonas sp. YM274]|uniref:glycoside hydrolase family 3 C-terminal domain-containing protein n=1 Tax=Mangrovimonas sp. YM274 TaxID=3070660 RepID=UPI0027DB0650|nr:glycoside hydrolase family 3 C-terminal domain-containing protein [Mangrovimonas sp. YM274]WMI67734.1 glycoside hydrolase family 3 C-terminal domain-containing protein [Mangrovimonas sp. YM274]
MRFSIRKPKFHSISLGLILVFLFAVACQKQVDSKESSNSEKEGTLEEAKQDFDFPFYNPSLPLDDRVEDLILRLTLEEKADQMMHNTNGVERLGIPAYSWWNEALHGVGRSGVATVFPQAIGLGATFDEDLALRVSSAISDEARAMYNAAKAKGYYKRYGGLTFWTPNINIFRDPRWGRGQETYGEDPYLTARLGTAFVKGLQGEDPNYLKTAACAKHYAVHSGPEKLRHEFDAKANPKDLWETYLPAFEALVNADVEAVMCAYNSTNGAPCCANEYLISDVLLEKWQFKGHVLSDCWAIVDFFTPSDKGGHGTVETAAQASALAVKNRVSLNCGSTYLEGIPEAVKQGILTEAEVDRELATLLKTRFKLGLFDPEGSNQYDSISIDVVDSDEHRALAREVAQKGIVMLKNNGALPLKNDLARYFVTGPHAANSDVLLGNYFGVNPKLVTVLEGIAGAVDHASQLQYRMGIMLDQPNANPQDWTTPNAGKSDATIAVLGISGLLEGEEGESIASATLGDRFEYGLPENQLEFLRKLRKEAGERPIITVITGGSPIDLAEVEALSDAVLFVWYPGEEGGNAVADILFGKVSPSGRLPITFPKSYDQLPAYEDYTMNGRTYKYMEKEPLYPFGFGLSYTTFNYGTPKLSSKTITSKDTVTVSVEVTNSGNVDSDEVVQLYVTDTEASFKVPNFQLQAVDRSHFKAGESKILTFELGPEAFEVVNAKGERVIEPGAFKIYIGGSSPMKRSHDLGASQPAEVTVVVK